MTSARTQARMIERLREQGIRDEVVLSAMLAVPRHRFVDEALGIRAYDDVPLPIGHGQTISQPWVVARMTELARNGRELDGVLEIGTGCGYQTAVLAKLVKEVYTLERIAPLMDKARRNLRELRFYNVRFKHVDGHAGYAEGAPYDGIMVTACASHIPAALKEQLAVGGRMVVPVGVEDQWLYVVDRTASGYTEQKREAVRFVPLVPGIT
jgi:protein-L-isoaspartate(D-aspartate) O-methyltransferase